MFYRFLNTPLLPLSVVSEIGICGTLCDTGPFSQFKRREKHLWRSVTCLIQSNIPLQNMITFFNFNILLYFFSASAFLQNFLLIKKGEENFFHLSLKRIIRKMSFLKIRKHHFFSLF